MNNLYPSASPHRQAYDFSSRDIFGFLLYAFPGVIHMMTIGGKIGVILTNNGWRQKDLAEVIYVSPSTVCSVKKYVENLRAQAGPIDVWNEQAWCLLVTQVTVHSDGSAEFLFRGENRITVK